MTIELTDAQLAMMSAAAHRNDRCLAPGRLKGAAAQKVGEKFVTLGMARGIKAKPEMPVWRHDEAKQPLALKLTPVGLKAIAIQQRPAAKLEVDEKPLVERAPLPANSAGETEPFRDDGESAPREGTKLAVVIGLLRRTDGATLVNLPAATGWQSHTTRAAITGLRKRGYRVTRDKDEAGASIYRVIATPTQESGSPPGLTKLPVQAQNNAKAERAA